MEMNKGAVGIFLALCVTGGATGYYLATSGQPEPVLGAAPSELAVDPAAPPAAAPAAAPIAAPAPIAPAPRTAAVSERRIASAPRSAPAVRQPAPAVVRERAPVPAAAPQRPVASVEAASVAPAAPAPVRSFEPEPVETASAEPEFLELVVPAESVIGLELETALTSERAQVEDEVVARVSRDVRVNDRVAVPAGATARGQVTLVERGGRLRQRARLGIRFTSIVLADGTRVPLDTETIYREGDSPGGESAAKIGGGAIGGAIIGGILGGAKGAVIGGSVGAGAGTAAVYAGGRNAATLGTGAPLTIRLIEPATVAVEN